MEWMLESNRPNIVQKKLSAGQKASQTIPHTYLYLLGCATAECTAQAALIY